MKYERSKRERYLKSQYMLFQWHLLGQKMNRQGSFHLRVAKVDLFQEWACLSKKGQVKFNLNQIQDDTRQITFPVSKSG